jgi:hypothetical protein
MSKTRLAGFKRLTRSARALMALTGAAALLTGGVALARGEHHGAAKHHHAANANASTGKGGTRPSGGKPTPATVPGPGGKGGTRPGGGK